MLERRENNRVILWCNGCGRQAGGEYWKPPEVYPPGWIEGDLGRHYCPTCAYIFLKQTDHKESPIDNKNQEKPTELSVWINSSEKIPGKKTQWVLGRSDTGKIWICRWSRSLEIWVDSENREIKDEITHWTYIPEFP